MAGKTCHVVAFATQIGLIPVLARMDATQTLRIFADHYQFWVYDAEFNPFDPLPEYADGSRDRGWTRTDHAISFLTRADLNDHRLDVYFGQPNSLLGAARVSVHPLILSTGRLALYDTEETLLAQLPAGPYAVVLAAYNLGLQQPIEDEELNDAEFLAHLEWERYELYVLSGVELPTDGPYANAG